MKDLTFDEMAIVIALHNTLYNKKHFSICTVDTAGKVLGINMNTRKEYDGLNTLHCVDYKDMGPEMTQELRRRVLDLVPEHIKDYVLRRAGLPASDEGCVERDVTPPDQEHEEPPKKSARLLSIFSKNKG